MNIQLDNVVSDLMGKMGTAILRAIIEGERNPQQLATLRDRRLHADEETVARRLHGNWREEHLFALKQALEHYDFLNQQIQCCNQLIEQQLVGLPQRAENSPEPVKVLKNAHRTKEQQSTLNQALYGVMGVDLTAIPTIGIEIVLVLASEVGSDLSKFPNESNFCSWLNVAPLLAFRAEKNYMGELHMFLIVQNKRLDKLLVVLAIVIVLLVPHIEHD